MTEGPVPVTEARPRRLIGAQGGGDGKGQGVRSRILKLRGLPFKVTAERVAAWFHEGVTYGQSLTPEK